MRALYLEGPVSVSMVSEGLKIKSGNDSRVWSPPYFPYDTVIVQNAYGYVSFAALRILMSLRISVSVLDFQGRLLGHVAPYVRRFGDLQTKQFRAVNDPKKRLRIAKAIVIRGYRRRGVASHLFDAATDIPDLMRREARLADEMYWPKWRARLSEIWPDHDFDTRTNPRYQTRTRAVNRVNSALNYGYALLESACRTMCARVGLSPLHGFLHSTQTHDAEPLVYDFEELGRAWIEDAVLGWFTKPENRRAFVRESGWVTKLRDDKVASYVAHVAPKIKTEVLLRDAREIVSRL